jgi:EipB-like
MHRSEPPVAAYPFCLRLVAGAALSSGLALGAGAPPSHAAPVNLLPHRAAYRLSLAEAESSSGLAAVRGGLVLEWRAACDGWLSLQRLGFVAESDEGPGFTYDVRFSSWESRDNTQLRFNVRSFDGPRMQEEFRGLAKLEAPGAKGTARYSLPEGDVVELPAGTIFPTEHVADLIEAAQAGERVVSRQVFDGSGENALTRATAIIGRPKAVRLAGGAAEERRWPVGIAYFGEGKAEDDALPQFEISFDLSEGGVLHDVKLDYGEFTLDARLEKLETFEQPDCR